MIKRIYLLVVLLGQCLLLKSEDFIITKFGAINDSTVLETEAIQKVIDKESVHGVLL